MGREGTYILSKCPKDPTTVAVGGGGGGWYVKIDSPPVNIDFKKLAEVIRVVS